MNRKKNKKKKRKVSSDKRKQTKKNTSLSKFPTKTVNEFKKALQYHQSGQLQKADELYQKILHSNPNHPDSLHLSGVIAYQVGKIDKAIYMINKAIQCDPENPLFHNNLGNAFKEQNKLNEAISCYKKALELKPDYAEPYNNMGIIFNDLGRLNEAISSYQKALDLKSDYAEVYNNMGNTLKNQGKLNESISCCKKALDLKPDNPVAYNNLGNAFKEQKNLTEAVLCYKKALEIKPDYSKAYYNLGNSFKDQGKTNEADSCYQKVLELSPGNADVHNSMGAMFQDRGKLTEAISCYQKAIKIKPDYAEAYTNMGSTLKDQGKLSEAISCCQKALELNPDLPEAYNNMGNAYKELNKLTDAIQCYQKALEIKPDFSEVHNNMGTAFQAQENPTEAILCYRKAIKIRPDYAKAYYNLGYAFQDQTNSNDAILSYQKALELNPDYADAYDNMGTAFQSQGKLNEAISNYQKALELKPDCAEVYSRLFLQFQQICDWQELEGMTARLDDFTTKALDNGTKTAETPFINLMRHAGPSRNFAVAKSWSRDIEKAISSLKVHFPFEGRSSSKTKIIVGYLSNDFQNHAMAHLTLSLYGLHNRNEFEIFCYSYGEDDGSYYRKRIQQDCNKFVDIRNLNDTDAARRIYEDRVGILVDLKGYTRGNRINICALRPAPIQVRYLGLAGTTGASFFDYITTDKIVTPEDHSQYYSENFAYMPHCYQINNHTQKISNKNWKKTDFGLPEDGFVFCSFNQGYKIEPVMFNTWMNILRQVPEGVLWLQRVNETAEKNLKIEAEARGVKQNRLIFADKLPKDEHLARLKLADLALDTRIVNGMITTSDALWAGVPVTTLQGSNFVSRVSSSILTAIGLPELITNTLEDYESIAINMARNPDKLQMIRRKIMENRTAEPLFDTPRFARNLEKAYNKMWKIFMAGESPRHIDVVES